MDTDSRSFWTLALPGPFFGGFAKSRRNTMAIGSKSISSWMHPVSGVHIPITAISAPAVRSLRGTRRRIASLPQSPAATRGRLSGRVAPGSVHSSPASLRGGRAWTGNLPRRKKVEPLVNRPRGAPVRRFRAPGMPTDDPPQPASPARGQEASVRCMERLAQGDESALTELYERWSGPLLSFLYGMCRDRALSEDLLQGVFLRVWKAAPRYKPLAKFSTWLFQIARNHWLNEREKKMRRIRPSSLDTGDPDEGTSSLASRVADDDHGPSERALHGELAEHIQEAVERLPEKLRSVWMLGAAQGLPYREVADVLEIPVGTVKSRMFQAVRLLREELAPYVSG